MKVLITGSRDWTDAAAVAEALREAQATVVIHGEARGADHLADVAARAQGCTVRGYAAEWNRYGRSAGPRRNQAMLDTEHTTEEPIDLCLAFPLPNSVGTWDMIRRAARAGILVRVIQAP